MIHLYNKIYINIKNELPNKDSHTSYSNDYDILELKKIYMDKKGKFFISSDREDIAKILSLHWKSYLVDKSDQNLKWLRETTEVDLKLKGILSFETSIPQTRAELPTLDVVGLSADHFSFEHVLASYFLFPDIARDTLRNKIEYFCWEQIIQEISVIRSEVNLLIYNSNINKILPSEYHLDFSDDIEAQIYNNPLLNWLFDENYYFSNIEHFKKNVNLEAITHFYDSWMIARKPINHTEETENSLDNLKWITNAIMNSEWEKLLSANLERNFGLVYIDNTMIYKANQVWGSSLLRDYNNKNLQTAERLALRPELFKG